MSTPVDPVYSDEFYWEHRWKKNEIEFHKNDKHQYLLKNFRINLNKIAKIAKIYLECW